MKEKVYVVTAYRWGERSNHSYVVGVCSKKEAAIKMADFERQYRGGKYECEVLEVGTTNKFDLKFSPENYKGIQIPNKDIYSTGKISNN